MRRRSATVAALVAALLLTALLVAWTLRFRIASDLVERRLARAGVPASYRITRLGPLMTRVEDLRIGDPASPDLFARRLDLLLGYTSSGAFVRAVRADGVQLRGRVDASGLSLGALDRLLPRSKAGGPALPDLGLTLHDAVLRLATPAGPVDASLDGSGNPQRSFSGRAGITAAGLRVGSCDVAGVRARMDVVARSGRPRLTGPVRVAQAACPGLAFARGGAILDVSADARLSRFAARARLTGATGRAGPVRFAALTGPVEASGQPDALAMRARLNLSDLSAPGPARTVAGWPSPLAGTPLAPTAGKAARAVAGLLSRANAEALIDARSAGGETRLAVRRVVLSGSDGARLVVSERLRRTATSPAPEARCRRSPSA